MSDRVLSKSALVLFWVLTVAFIVVIADTARAYFSAALWSWNAAQLTILTVILALIIASFAGKWLVLPNMRRPKTISPPPNLRVGVATTYVPGSEPLDMLERTLTAMVAMNY